MVKHSPPTPVGDDDDLPIPPEERLDLSGPSPPAPPLGAVDARRALSWSRVFAQMVQEPPPPVSAWSRLLALTRRGLPDLGAILITRSARPIFHHVPAIAAGLVKGDGGADVPPSPGAPIALDVFHAGDILSLTCVLPTAGGLVVMLREGASTTRVRPRNPEDLQVLPAGSRVRVQGRLIGSGHQELVVALSAAPLAAELLSLEGDALLAALAESPDLAMVRYSFSLGTDDHPT